MFRTLNLDFAGMSLQELHSLVDALETAGDVLSGLQEQPRFSCGKPDPYNKAGDHLESVRTAIGFEIDAAREHAKTVLPATDDEAEYKFALLASIYISPSDRPAQSIRQIASIAADIEWERVCASTRAAQ